VKRHMRDSYYVLGEGILTTDENGRPVCERPSTEASLRKFRFSRLGPENAPSDPNSGPAEEALHIALANAMTGTPSPDSGGPGIPAGFTYLGQFVDHDLTMDNTAASLGSEVTVDELLQGRSPALDLDSLYGMGPKDKSDARFYESDGAHLRVGRTAAVPIDGTTNQDRDGYDLPRVGQGSTKNARRAAVIPDARNDENLVVAQTHAAFIRFHNRVVDTLASGGTPSSALFEQARRTVIQHYQWLLHTDFLPRIVDRAIVDDVFTNGRRFFEVPTGYTERTDKQIKPGDTPTMPIEFSIAAYRLGHSMVRDSYEWNRFFNSTSTAIAPGLLQLLFQFSGTSGTLSPDGKPDDPDSGSFERLPTNWIADLRRLYDFTEAGRMDLAKIGFNLAKRIDTLLVNPLKNLPLGSFAGQGGAPGTIRRNLAFRNLTRATMVNLASGQQMAEFLGATPLSAQQLLAGDGGAVLDPLSQDQRDQLVGNTPLWFYILREAELNSGRLGAVGGRIVAEVFHRAIEGSRVSILRHPEWRPTLGPNSDTFRMVDLLLFAFDGKEELLNPLGD
jgi:Animal haem peroxidase